MSIDVAEVATGPEAAAEPPRTARLIALAVAGALLLGGLGAAYVYRQTVTSERQQTFDAVVAAQVATAYAYLAQVGYGQVPADASALNQRVRYELTYLDPNHRVAVSTPRIRLGGATQYVQVDAEMYNYDLPGWVGDRSYFLSVLIFGTYTNDANGVTSDEGSCVIRVGTPDAPVLTEEVELPNGVLATPCTSAQTGDFEIR